MERRGPLVGLKVLEFAAIGPVPFAGMLLSDLGADVVRIDRRGGAARGPQDVTFRGRRSVGLDLKAPSGAEAALRLMQRADALIEGFRPGVMERLGLGPELALARNPRLVYGRMTGWGQSGPLAKAAGHDLNFIALSGALHAIGPQAAPAIPLNLVGDYGGGALYLAFGLLAAVMHARATGEGQVVDCAMSDGAISLMAQMYGLHSTGDWADQREANVIDGGAHFYNVYRCRDGEWISVAAPEPGFYQELRRLAGLQEEAFDAQWSAGQWPQLKGRMAEVFATRTRAEWCALLEGTDACFAPVLSLSEAPAHPHNRARGAFVSIDDIVQPAPQPKFSLTPGAVQGPAARAGAHNRDALSDWGLEPAEIDALEQSGAL